MNDLYIRKNIVTINNRAFTDPLTINFDVAFDDSKELNTITIEIYNLKDSTIASLKKNSPVTLQAGYVDDYGIVFEGLIKKTTTEWQGVDKKTKIECVDDSGDKWNKEKIKKAYKGPIDAKTILKDLISKTGLVTGDLSLPKNHVYKSGKTFNSLVSKATIEVAKDCNAKVHINKKQIFIRGKNESSKIAYQVNKGTGLIGSPTPIEKEEAEPDKKSNAGEEKKKTLKGWSVKVLLDHRITVDSMIILKSKTANGTFRVSKGMHNSNGNTHYTEMEVFPL
ncbi:phage protein [Bacillus sp. JJ722]|uniref:phage protein n=1 Tax=Bacillus sp. JJ722 TaxID=3122973 RepID=UPI002FFEDA06